MTRTCLAGIVCLLAVAAPHAQERFYLLSSHPQLTLQVGAVTSSGQWVPGQTIPIAGFYPTAVAISEGGRHLYALGESGPGSTVLARADLRTGAAEVLPGLAFPRGSALVADPRSSRILVVSPNAVTVVDDGQVVRTLALSPLPGAPGGVAARLGGHRLFLVRWSSLVNSPPIHELLAIDADLGVVEQSRSMGVISPGPATRDGSRLFAITGAGGFNPTQLEVIDGATLAPLVAVDTASGVGLPVLVDEARGFAAYANNGTAFGGPGLNGPSGMHLLDAATLAPLGVVAPGLFDGNAVLAASRPSSRSHLVVVSHQLFPGYAGGPRNPRVDVIDGTTGRVTAQVSLGVNGVTGGAFLLGVAVPDAPTGLTATAQGSVLTLDWTRPDHATSFELEAGTAPGLRNLLIQRLGRETTLTLPNVPPGTYYVRIRAVNDVGAGEASNEVQVVVQ